MVGADTNTTAPVAVGISLRASDQQPPAAVGRPLDVAPGERSAFGDPQHRVAHEPHERDVDASSSCSSLGDSRACRSCRDEPGTRVAALASSASAVRALRLLLSLAGHPSRSPKGSLDVRRAARVLEAAACCGRRRLRRRHTQRGSACARAARSARPGMRRLARARRGVPGCPESYGPGRSSAIGFCSCGSCWARPHGNRASSMTLPIGIGEENGVAELWRGSHATSSVPGVRSPECRHGPPPASARDGFADTAEGHGAVRTPADSAC